jgi:tripartite-type tricarboxylate transporter receptor subunit TctC
MKRFLAGIVLLTLAALVFAEGSGEVVDGVWKPTKPVNVIVPWGAGGSTDQIIRLCAGILEPKLGQKIVVTNQGGASGSVGTKSVMDAPRDGYTWASGAAADLGTYKIQGMLDTVIGDWTLFLSVANISVISVNASSPYKTFDDLLQAFRAKPGQVAVATAGQSSAGHIAIETLKKYTGIQYKHVTYDGGNPAVIAVVSGEAEVVPQLAVEEADMLRAGKLRALAVLDSKPMTIKGLAEPIPPITNWIKDFKPGSNYFGIFLPKGTPDYVVSTVGKLWDEVIAKSPEIQTYALERGAVFAPSWGQEAQTRVFGYLQPVAWLYFEAGKAKISPDTVGIPKP